MPLETFQILLDNPQSSFFAGQMVTGQVVLQLTHKAKPIHGIKIKLQGKAKTHWKEWIGCRVSHFSADEVYLDEKIYLLGHQTDSSEMTLEQGTHKYKFQFPLPLSLPSSYCHKYGEVKYFLDATITRNRKCNYTSKLPFTVNGILQLNSEMGAGDEGEISSEKFLCCFCCTSGPLGFHLKVPKKGFVPGESIGFQMNLYNHSNRDVTLTSISLVQNLKFKADLDWSKKKCVEVAKVEGPKVARGESKDWIMTSDISPLKVPSLPPSRLDGCKLIHISYFIKFKMEAKNGGSCKERLPITIGTIPLRDDFSQLRNPSDFNYLKNYPDLPPPTYEEALNGTKAEDAESNASDPPDYGSVHWKTFIPKYVSYKLH